MHSLRAHYAAGLPGAAPVRPFRPAVGQRQAAWRLRSRHIRCEQQQQPQPPGLQPNQIQLPKARRSLQVSFTCDKCGSRSTRLVNPGAWERGTVLAQCEGCAVWHKLRDEMNLIDEVRYADESDEEPESPQPDEGV